MKKIGLMLCAAVIGMTVASCGSSKKVVDNGNEAAACAQCMSTKQALRAEGSFLAAYENQVPKAKQAAANNARQELARMMQVTVESVIEDYSSTYIDGDAQDFRQSLKDLSRTVVSQTVKGAVPAIPGWSEKMKSGTMYYVCLEVSADSVIEAINEKVSADSKLRTDFEYEKFKKVFDQEMEKLAE
ncbi:MAG: hypothetical protein MJZ90_01700 [Bacteroidales bacterium]|nr:hypothetical protein [Bacteroidales bacterium]